jgi:hypothetical protein
LKSLYFLNAKTWLETSPLLFNVVKHARSHAWSFVPEPYQYKEYGNLFGTLVDSLDKYLEQKNESIQGMTNKEILLVKDFKKKELNILGGSVLLLVVKIFFRECCCALSP